jgi:ribosome maturation protein Sdo1
MPVSELEKKAEIKSKAIRIPVRVPVDMSSKQTVLCKKADQFLRV